MDCSNVPQPFVAPEDESLFTCGSDSFDSCWCLESNGDEIIEHDLRDDDAWRVWFATPRFQGLKNLPNNMSLGNGDGGYEILLSPCAEPEIFMSNGVEKMFDTPLNELPISQDNWNRVVETFFVHKGIVTAAQSRIAPGYSAYFHTTAARAGDNRGEVEVLIACSPQSTGTFAVSSTYYPKANFTTAVFFGLDYGQMIRIRHFLRTFPQYRGHRLLAMGLFAELQRDQLDERASAVKKETDDISTTFETYREQGMEPAIGNHELQTKLRKARLNAALVQEDIRATQAHLKALISKIENPLVPQSNRTAGETPDIGTRFKLRFEEICREYDSLKASCQLRSDVMSFTRDLCMAEISSREAKASKALGFAAMIYLPMSSLATIFAMPIFDWKARWLDHNDNFVPSNPTNDSSSASTQATMEDPGGFAVLSGYFWIYLALTIVSTVLTVALYMLYAWNWRVPYLMPLVDVGTRFVNELVRTMTDTYKKPSSIYGRLKDRYIHDGTRSNTDVSDGDRKTSTPTMSTAAVRLTSAHALGIAGVPPNPGVVASGDPPLPPLEMSSAFSHQPRVSAQGSPSSAFHHPPAVRTSSPVTRTTTLQSIPETLSHPEQPPAAPPIPPSTFAAESPIPSADPDPQRFTLSAAVAGPASYSTYSARTESGASTIRTQVRSGTWGPPLQPVNPLPPVSSPRSSIPETSPPISDRGLNQPGVPHEPQQDLRSTEDNVTNTAPVSTPTTLSTTEPQVLTSSSTNNGTAASLSEMPVPSHPEDGYIRHRASTSNSPDQA